MRVLITRPREEAESLAASLAGRGIEPLIEPLLEIRPIDDGPLPLAGVQAVLLTSANGARAFAAREPGRALPVFAVGERTAEVARDAGFVGIESANGAIPELAALVASRLDPKDGALLHAGGAAIAGDLTALLAPQGFELRRVVLYEAVAAARLSGATQAALRDGRLDAVLFFSPRTAATFVSLVQEAELEGCCGGLDALCLSQAVADAASGLPWRGMRVAARPEQTALLDLLVLPRGALPRGATRVAATAEPGFEAGGGNADRNAVDRAIRALGGIRPAAAKLGVPVTTVQGWKSRGHIPPNRVPGVIAAARRHGIELEEEALSDRSTLTAGSPAMGNSPTSGQPIAPAHGGEPRATPPRRPSRAATIALWLMLPAAFLIAAAIALPYWAPLVGGTPMAAARPDSNLQGLVSALDTRLGRLEAKLDELAKPQPGVANLSGLPDRLDQAERKLGALERSYAELAARPEPKPGIDPAQLAAVNDQIAGLRTEIDKVAADAVLLADRLVKLEEADKKSALLDARQAAFLLALGQLRAALAGSAPYAPSLDVIAALAGGDAALAPAIATLKERAARGIPTLSELRARYEAASLAAARAAMVPEQSGWLGRAWARLKQLVVIRRLDVDGGGTDAALARGEARLAAADLKGAVEAVSSLQGRAATAMAPWLADARARLAAEAAMSSLGTYAIARLGEAQPDAKPQAKPETKPELQAKPETQPESMPGSKP